MLPFRFIKVLVLGAVGGNQATNFSAKIFISDYGIFNNQFNVDYKTVHIMSLQSNVMTP